MDAHALRCAARSVLKRKEAPELVGPRRAAQGRLAGSDRTAAQVTVARGSLARAFACADSEDVGAAVAQRPATAVLAASGEAS